MGKCEVFIIKTSESYKPNWRDSESYRDLLKTAERIIEMNESIQQVENHLSQASKQCNYGYVQKKAANAVMMKAQQHERGKASADNSQV